MLAIKLPAHLEDRLKRLARGTHRAEVYYIRRAIEEYLDEKEDYLIARSRSKNRKPSITLNQVAKRLRLKLRHPC